MTINNIDSKYLEHCYLPRIVDQHRIYRDERDPVSTAANTAIISGISAVVTNIFQFVIPQGIPQISMGTLSFGFLIQNLTLGAFSFVLGVFALGRFKQSITLTENFIEENTKVLESRQVWGTSLKQGLQDDIIEITKLQSDIDTKNLQFLQYNLACFTAAIVLVALNALFSFFSLEILATITIGAMIGAMIFFAYHLGSHWNDNKINKKKMEALHLDELIRKLNRINYPENVRRQYQKKIIALPAGPLPIDLENTNISVCPGPFDSDSPYHSYKLVSADY